MTIYQESVLKQALVEANVKLPEGISQFLLQAQKDGKSTTFQMQIPKDPNMGIGILMSIFMSNKVVMDYAQTAIARAKSFHNLIETTPTPELVEKLRSQGIPIPDNYADASTDTDIPSFMFVQHDEVVGEPAPAPAPENQPEPEAGDGEAEGEKKLKDFGDLLKSTIKQKLADFLVEMADGNCKIEITGTELIENKTEAGYDKNFDVECHIEGTGKAITAAVGIAILETDFKLVEPLRLALSLTQTIQEVMESDDPIEAMFSSMKSRVDSMSELVDMLKEMREQVEKE